MLLGAFRVLRRDASRRRPARPRDGRAPRRRVHRRREAACGRRGGRGDGEGPGLGRRRGRATCQGGGAADDIVQGIRELNDHSNADILIVGRGGGSIEDLWCFNEEIVARAIASSKIPVISAVGHETDFTLADFAADLRAPTPSVAAELAVSDAGELREIIAGYRTMLRQRILDKVDDLSRSVEAVKKGLSSDRFMQYLMLKSQAIDELNLRMKSAYSDVITDREKALERLKGELIAMYPKSVLSRGYSIVYKQHDNTVVTDRKMVAEGDYVSVELARGRFSAQVTD